MNRKRKSDRRGVFTVGVILVIIVVATLVMAFTRSLIAQGRADRVRRNHRQAAWLAEAGLDRAVAKSQADAQYRGETWRLADDQIEGGADVLIEVETVNDNTQSLRVVARFPISSRTPATAEATLELNPSNSGEKP